MSVVRTSRVRRYVIAQEYRRERWCATWRAVLQRVRDGLSTLTDPTARQAPAPTAAAPSHELAPLVRAVLARRPEAAQPAERVEPSPDVVRTQPLGVVGVAS